VHQGVDLHLGVVERHRRGLLHLPVDDLTHPRVQAHLGVVKGHRVMGQCSHL